MFCHDDSKVVVKYSNTLKGDSVKIKCKAPDRNHKLKHCVRQLKDCEEIINKTSNKYSNVFEIQRYIEEEKLKDVKRKEKALDIGKHF